MLCWIIKMREWALILLRNTMLKSIRMNLVNWINLLKTKGLQICRMTKGFTKNLIISTIQKFRSKKGAVLERNQKKRVHLNLSSFKMRRKMSDSQVSKKYKNPTKSIVERTSIQMIILCSTFQVLRNNPTHIILKRVWWLDLVALSGNSVPS